MGMETESAIALRLGAESGLFRSRDAAAAGVSRTTLSRLTANGDLMWVSRGVYQLPQARQVDPIAVLATTHSGVVVCLLSALAHPSRSRGLTYSVYHTFADLPNRGSDRCVGRLSLLPALRIQYITLQGGPMQGGQLGTYFPLFK